MKKLLILSLLLLIPIFIISCTVSKDPAYDSLISRLKNRGIIALSGDNPYMASNLLITKEIESNESLRGFTNFKGVPNLIEVNKEYLRPLRYKFYYPNEQSYYNLELVNDTWVINGPETINAAQAQQIYYLTGGNIKTPNIMLKDNNSINNINNNFNNSEDSNFQNDAFGVNTNQNTNANNNVSNNAPNNVPQNNNAQIVKSPEKKNLPTINNKNQNTGYKGAINQAAKSNSTNTKEQSDTVLDNIINNTTTYSAELNYQGDLIHYVSYKGETLSLISRWYTKDPSNADKIARINSRKATDSLLIGDKIVIPSYLLKNKNKLTQKALQDMIAVYVGNSNNNSNIQNNTFNNHTGYQGAAPSAPKNNVNVPVNNNQKPANITIPKNIDGSEVEFF